MTSNEQTEQAFDRVIQSLDKVHPDTKKMIFNLSNQMTEMEIIQSFNQQSLYLFTLVSSLAKKMKKEKEYQLTAYKSLFDNAIKINVKMPIDKFTLMILEFAAEIYTEDEDCFLNMTIPDKKCSVGNEYSFIRSEKFKDLWKILDKSDKKTIADNVILLTTYAHAYLYKTIFKNHKM